MTFPPTLKRVLATWILVAVLSTQTVRIDLSQSKATQEHLGIVAILVDETLYSDSTDYAGLSDEFNGLQNTTLKARIDRYAALVQSVMPLTKSIIIRTQPDEKPEHIIQALEKLYFEGDGTPDTYTELRGVVLVGELPIPVINKNENRYLSMYPYTDFEDRAYLFNATTGDFEPSPQVSNPQPEVWHGVIRAPSEGDDGKEQLADYFDKNYLYHQGYEDFTSFDQKFFYADTVAEAQALSQTGIQAYQRFIDHWEDVAYYRYTHDLARELYEEVYGSIEGGDGQDNDGDGLTDEDPVNGSDDDDDGLIDEDDGNFDYGIDNDRDCWEQNESDWDSNGDGRPCYLGDDLVDEDGPEDNNADGDLQVDEDEPGDANGDGCSGKCDTDDDGDQADWDDDGWPNGWEDEVLQSNKSKKRSPFWYKAKSLNDSEEDILNAMYTDEEYPTFDPYCWTPYESEPLPSEYFDGTLTFQPNETDRNGDRCFPSACESDLSNDDDEDGACDEDGVDDNDADGDGETDEDRAGDPDGGADMFEELPDIQSKTVVDSFFKKYPALFQKFIGNLNVWTDYTGRYESSRTNASGYKTSDRETIVGLIGQRDEYTLKVLRAVNDLLEDAVYEVVDEVANDIPLIGRITISGEVEDSDGNTESYEYEFINHAVRHRFWYPDQIYINGNSADEITSIGQCSIYRGSYDEGGENQLVKGLRVYNYETAGDYDDDGEPYGGCFGNFAETPEYCFPELAENPVRSQIGTVEVEDDSVHVDYRSCYNFKESEEFLGTSYSASDSSYSENVEGYWYYAKELLQGYADLLEDLDDGKKDEGDDQDGDGDYDEDDFDLEVEEIKDDLHDDNAYNVPVKDPDDIYLFGESGDDVYYTFGAFLTHFGIDKDSQEEIGGFFADNQSTYEFDVDEYDSIESVTLTLGKEYIREDDTLLSSALTGNESDAYTVPSILEHIEPIVSTINKQVSSGFSESLPIDDPRFITFQDQTYEYQEILYPNVFDVSSWGDLETLLQETETAVLQVPSASGYTGFLTGLLETEIFEPQMSDVFAWHAMNIDEKHLWILENYLDTEAVPYVGQAEDGYEVLYMVAEGDADRLNMSFFGNTVGEDPDVEFQDFEGEKEEAEEEEDYDVNDPDSDHVSWFPFVWIYDIMQWIEDLSTTTANQAAGTVEKSANANFEYEFACASDSFTATDSDNDGIADEEDEAPYSMDDDDDGVPDGAGNTTGLLLEWDDDRVLYANGADMSSVTVYALDASGNINTDDTFSTVELQITSGEDYGQILSIDGATLIDGKASLTIASTQAAGTFTLQAIGASDNLEGVTSNTLTFTSSIRRLKLATYEKAFVTEEVTYTTETLEDVLVLDENGNVVAIISASTGEVTMVNTTDYRLEARVATTDSPTRLVIVEQATGAVAATFYLFPDVHETVLETSADLIQGMVDNVRLLDSNPSDTWSASYVETEGGDVMLYGGDEAVGLLKSDGSLFLESGVALTLEPAGAYAGVDNVHLHLTINLGEQVLFDVVIGSDTTFLEMEDTSEAEPTAFLRKQGSNLDSRFRGNDISNDMLAIPLAQAATSELLDSDGDALDDLSEWTIGTDLYDVDTDDDLYADSVELENGYNPLGSGPLFTDFSSVHEAYEAVIELFKRGIISGYDDGSFQPNRSITREEFTKLNLGAVCVDCTAFTDEAVAAIEQEYADHPFPDTDIDEALYYCVAHSRNEELISGYKGGDDEGYYLPKDTMTRAEATKVLLETAAFSVDEVNDLSLPWYFYYVVEAQKNALYPSGRFTPIDTYDSDEFETWLREELSKGGSIQAWLEGQITRAEFAMMVGNLLRAQDCSLDDADGDGLPDNTELYNTGTSPYNADTDYGGVNDFVEVVNNTNAISDPSDDSLAATLSEGGSAEGDSDGDGLLDEEEVSVYGTDPHDPDTDDGGITDGAEVEQGSDPLEASDDVDSDGDGLSDTQEATYGSDPLDPDSDDDGLTDYEEVVVYGTDPNDPDTDDGGVSDYEEVLRGSDPLDASDDSSDLSDALDTSAGATVSGGNLSQDFAYQVDSFSEEVLFEQNVFTKLIPADGTSQLYLRATIIDEEGNPVMDDNESVVEFVAVDPAYPYATILREQVQVTDGIAETEILASTTSGYFAVTASITPTTLPVLDTSVYVYPGEPATLLLTPDSTFLKSGGLNATDVSLILYDAYGNIASMSPSTVTLSAEGPLNLDESLDEDSEQEGVQVTLYEGVLTFKAISGEEEGTGTIHMTLDTLETETSIGVYDNIALTLQSANESLTANGSASTTLTAWAVLDDAGEPLQGFNGTVTFSLVDDLYGTLPETTSLTMTDGQAEIDFTASTVAGTAGVTVSMIGFEPTTLEFMLLPGDPALLELSSDVAVIPVGGSADVTVRAFDTYGNWVFTDDSTEVEVRVTDFGSDFGSVDPPSQILAEGEAVFEVTATDLTGPINLVASAGGLESAELSLKSVLEMEATSLGDMDLNTLFVALLGAPFGDVTEEDYFAGWFTFSGKTQASVSLLSEPNPHLRLASIDAQGTLRVLDGNAVDIEITPANSPDLPTRFLVKDLRTSQTVADGAVILESSTFTLLEPEDDLSQVTEEGVYVQLLTTEERYALKETTAKASLSSGRSTVTLGSGASGETRVSLVEDNNEVVRLEADGQVQIFDANYGLQLNEAYEGFAFDVTLGDVPIARVNWKQSFEEDVVELSSDFEWDNWALLDPGVYLRLPLSETYGSTAALSGNSSQNPQGIFVVDKTQELPNKQKPGLGFTSLESAADEPGIGFKGDNKFMLSLSDGLTVGESNLFYASDIGVVLGDPTIRLTDVNPLDVSSTGFTSGIGRMMLAGNEAIQDLSVIDYNSDGLEDVMIAFEDGLIELLENTNAYPRFQDRGALLNITNGIVAMAQADFDQDGQTDLVVATKESCVEGEVCIYEYVNDDGNFTRTNLDLELAGDGLTVKQIVAEDLNQDDYPDLVLSDLNGSIFVYYNDGGMILTQGDEIGNVGLKIDDSLNLIEEVLLHYDGMPEEDPDDFDDNDDFKDFSTPVEGSYDNTFADKFSDVDSAIPMGGFSTDFVSEVLEPMTAGNIEGLEVTIDSPNLKETVTYVYADADDAFVSSTKTAMDVNGDIVEDGDTLEYTVALFNDSASTIKELSVSDSVSSLLELDWDSFECSGGGCSSMTVTESGSGGSRPFVVSGLSIGAGETLTLTYQGAVSGTSMPAVQLLVGQDLDSAYTDDNYMDIGASPEDNPSGQMLFFYSNGTYRENGLTKINYTKYTSTAEDPVDLSDQFEALGIDLNDLDEDGNPKALNFKEGSEEPPAAANDPYEEVAKSDSEDELNTLWSNYFVPVDDPGDVMTNIAKGVVAAEASLQIAEAVMMGFADFVEQILTQFMCSGGCIATPINYGFLVPGPINVLGIPVSPMDWAHIPIFAAPVPGLPPIWPPIPAWQASTAVRIYVSITLTLGVTLSVCVGPYLVGQCWTINLTNLISAITPLGGLCDAINGAVSSALSKASSFISEGANKLMSLDGGGGQSGGRSESGGLVNYNLGSYLVAIGGSKNQLVPGFPKPFAEWARKQMAEVTDLADLPDIYFYYPDFKTFFTTAFVPDKEALKDADLRGLSKTLSYINSIPLLKLETQEVSFKFPALTKEEIDQTVIEFTQWLDYHKHLWDQVKESWEASVDTSVRNVVTEIETVFRQVEKNIEILEDYKDFPRELLKWRYVEAFYIKQIICYLDTIINWMGGWLLKNTKRVEKWVQAYYDLIEALASWKLILDLFIDFQKSCDQCKNQRLSLWELLAKLFIFIPEPPIIDLPKLPDIVIDFSQIQAGVIIQWPELKFVPEPLLIPDLPILNIPKLPTIDLDLPDIPQLPELPPLPDLPTLPGLPLPDLPDLPPPPEIPELPNSIQIVIKIGSAIIKILCLIQSGIIPTSELMLKTQVENMTQRPLSPLLPLDFSISFPSLHLGKDFVDVIEVVAVFNLSKGLRFDGILEMVKAAADVSNSIVTDLVTLINESAQGVSDTIQEGADTATDAVNDVTDTEVDVDLDSGNETDAGLLSLADEALLTTTAQNLLSDPRLLPYLDQWNFAIESMESDALAQAEISEAVPTSYTLQATSHLIAFTPDEIEQRFAEIENGYLTGTLSSLDDSPLPGLRNDLLTYFEQESQQTELLAQLLDTGTGWDDMRHWIATYETSGFSPTESRLLVSSPSDTGSSETVYSTEFSFLSLRETLFKTLANSTGLDSSLEALQESEERYLASSTSDTTASYDEARSAGQVSEVGIFLYNEEEAVNERLIDYTAEADSPMQLAFVDAENDGDDDIVYAMGGNVYFKENYTETEEPTYYEDDPDITTLEELMPEAGMVDLFSPTDVGNAVASLAWRPSSDSEDLFGYEMRSFESLTDFEKEDPDTVYWDHFLTPNDPLTPTLSDVTLDGTMTLSGTDYTEEEGSLTPDAFDANLLLETGEDSQLILSYEGATFTLEAETLFPVPNLQHGAVTLSQLQGAATLPEDQLQRTLVMDSGETTVNPGDTVHALEKSSLTLTLSDGGSIDIELDSNLLFPISTFYADPATVRVDDGSVEVIGQDTADETQTLYAGMLILEEEWISFDDELTAMVTSTAGTVATTYGGPGAYAWHSIQNPDVPQFTLSRENGEYYGQLRVMKADGTRGTWGNTILLSPQVCADDTPPYANLGTAKERVSVFKTLTLDGSGSFDSETDTDALKYWWDTDLENDTDGDGDATNDPDSMHDADPLIDTDGDGILTNDWSDPTLTVGPYDDLDTRTFKLWVEDEAGNETGAEATVEVYVPDISLSASAGRTGTVEGAIDPVDSDIPFVLVRERDGVYDLIETPTADENSKYYTDDNGEFTIDDLELSEAWVIYDSSHEAVAEVDAETGAITDLAEGYTVEVYTAELPWPTRVVLIDPSGQPLLYIFFVPDANVDVMIDVQSLEYTAETVLDMVGVHVKDVGLPEGVTLESIPSNEPLFTGGVAVVEFSGERAAIIDTDGNIYRLEDFELGVLDIEAVTESAGDEGAVPIVLTMGQDGQTWMQIYIATEEASYFADSSDLDVSLEDLEALGWTEGATDDEDSTGDEGADSADSADSGTGSSSDAGDSGDSGASTGDDSASSSDTTDGSYLSSLDESADTDGDGITDVEELQNGLDPYDASDADDDADGDGLSNGAEAEAGTSLLDPDTDDDGFSDAQEVANGQDATSAEESYFEDISIDDPLYDDIVDLVQLGVLEGYSETDGVYFQPDQFITRAEYAKILLGILCIIPRDEAYLLPHVFNDILDTALWYFPITKESYLQTFITGYLGEIDAEGLTPFKPNNTISRAEGTKIILEALETLGIIDMGEVAEEEPWYLPYIDIAKDLEPYAVGEFLGDETPYLLTQEEAGVVTEALTRYDFVVMATRVLDFYNCYALQDTDGDGLTDLDEVSLYGTDFENPDTDGDGLTDYEEIMETGSNAVDPDTDDGGINDGDEVASGSDPLETSDDDTDGDGLTDADERTVYGTDPYDADTDDGGINDGDEVVADTDPLVTDDDGADTDGDGLTDADETSVYGTDPYDSDTDDGGVSDGDEVAQGTEPTQTPEDDDDALEETVLTEDNVLDDLEAGLYIITEACLSCPCEVSALNTADLMEGDLLYAAIMDTANTVVLSISNAVAIEDLTP